MLHAQAMVEPWPLIIGRPSNEDACQQPWAHGRSLLLEMRTPL